MRMRVRLPGSGLLVCRDESAVDARSSSDVRPPKDAPPPSLVLDALHALRTERYPPGYWSAFFTASNAVSTASRTLLRDRAADFAALGIPTLIVTGRQDAVCDAAKLARLPDTFGPTPCTVIEVDSGHVFAGSVTRTIFTVSQAHLKGFLEG